MGSSIGVPQIRLPTVVDLIPVRTVLNYGTCWYNVGGRTPILQLKSGINCNIELEALYARNEMLFVCSTYNSCGACIFLVA